MQTFYIDIYFLINFTVDILALYFSALFTKVESTVKRLILSSTFGALLASVIALVVPVGFVFLAILLIGTWLTIEIFINKSTLLRKFKFYIAFLVFETLIGGFVNLIYNLLDTYIYPIVSTETFGAQNRTLLILSLIILIAYGLLKLLYSAFNNIGAEKNIEITIGLNDKEERITGLVDSGCLVCDPLDARPVIIVKKNSLEMIKDNFNISCSIDSNIKKRIRVIPIRSFGADKILMGIRTDYIKIKGRDEKYENIVIALDEEEGSYSGYSALVPLAMLE
ncbi:MAG: sigma-E processing peptidase SpoIIGA [Clostridia bacterium]|nr:sigma-E processing peptidase SpoIIGA [Clostridia bacterium]